MDFFATEHDVIDAAAELFALTLAQGARCEEAYARVVQEIFRLYPDLRPEMVAFSAGLGLGRWEARNRCGCHKSAPSSGRLQ